MNNNNTVTISSAYLFFHLSVACEAPQHLTIPRGMNRKKVVMDYEDNQRMLIATIAQNERKIRLNAILLLLAIAYVPVGASLALMFMSTEIYHQPVWQPLIFLLLDSEMVIGRVHFTMNHFRTPEVEATFLFNQFTLTAIPVYILISILETISNSLISKLIFTRNNPRLKG